MKVAICILTFPRGKDTVHSTVELVRQRAGVQDLEIALSVGHPDARYVDKIEGVTILHTPMSEWGKWGAHHGGFRLTRNTLRAHRWLASQGADICVFAEDDIEPCDHWLSRAIDLFSQVKDTNFCLCACSSHPNWCLAPPAQSPALDGFDFLGAEPAEHDTIMRFKNPVHFWGNQLLIYPDTTVKLMAAHLQACVATWVPPFNVIVTNGPNWNKFGDQAVKNFFCETGIPLYVTVPSLARHTGEINTWAEQGTISYAYKYHPTARFRP